MSVASKVSLRIQVVATRTGKWEKQISLSRIPIPSSIAIPSRTVSVFANRRRAARPSEARDRTAKTKFTTFMEMMWLDLSVGGAVPTNFLTEGMILTERMIRELQ